MNMKQKSERIKELATQLKELNQMEYMNYTISNNKIYGVPLKGQEIYKGCNELICDYEKHQLYYQLKIESMDIRASIFNYNDHKLNKQITNLKTYMKRFENAIKKLQLEAAV
jgi:DNA repair exonuclease SbcCD ATPase subunit